MNSPVVEHLEEWHASLSQLADFPSLEAKAEQIGLLNQIETALARLKMCEEHGIFPAAWICVLPPEINPEFPQPFYPEYRIVCDRESDEPQHWEEVRFEKRGS